MPYQKEQRKNIDLKNEENVKAKKTIDYNQNGKVDSLLFKKKSIWYFKDIHMDADYLKT